MLPSFHTDIVRRKLGQHRMKPDMLKQNYYFNVASVLVLLIPMTKAAA